MNFAELMEKCDKCCRKAIEAWKKKDFHMCNFWKSASEAYREKALNMEII